MIVFTVIALKCHRVLYVNINLLNINCKGIINFHYLFWMTQTNWSDLRFICFPVVNIWVKRSWSTVRQVISSVCVWPLRWKTVRMRPFTMAARCFSKNSIGTKQKAANLKQCILYYAFQVTSFGLWEDAKMSKFWRWTTQIFNITSVRAAGCSGLLKNRPLICIHMSGQA